MATQESDLPRPVDSLADWIMPKVEAWIRFRDQQFLERWDEYQRLWRGEWAPQDRNRQSERSMAIMPVIQQAVDSAVAEQSESAFARERWFDAAEPRAQAAADRLLKDTWHFKAPITETFLLGALYGTGISKIVIDEDMEFDLEPVDPRHFVIDPAAWSIEDALGVAHDLYLPKNVVERGMKAGIYETVIMDNASLDRSRMHLQESESTPIDTDIVRLVEWHGLVPARLLSDTEGEERIGPDGLIDAIVTIVNQSTVIREEINPYSSRAFVSYQHSTVPRRFWGRGVVEQGYWPQKVLDGEVRARTDSLAFSVHPMMGVNALLVPRGEKWGARPGKNLFINGDPREALLPLQFPPPDPGTYQQANEMERMIEMATGQLQASSPLGVNERNQTATGMSMILGASIRRTRKALHNIEREYLGPLIQKVHERKMALVPSYPRTANIKIVGGLGIMAREFELANLTQLMNAMPEGLPQMAILKLIIENSGLADKEEVIRVLEFSMLQAAQPQQEGPDAGDMARLMSAQIRAEEARIGAMEKAQKLEIERGKLAVEQEKSHLIHQRQMLEESTKAELAEAEIEKLKSESILNVAKAEAESLETTIRDLQATVEALALPAPQAAPEGESQPAPQGNQIEELMARLEALESGGNQPGVSPQDEAPIQVERDGNGLIQSVGGRPVRRDDRGLIAGLV